MTIPERLIIDTDPGVDDALAIFLALASPELDLVALTSSYGNVTAPLAADNARRLLDAAGRHDVVVTRGAAGPLAGDPIGPVGFIHGPEGLGDAVLNPPSVPHDARSSAQFLVDAVAAEPGDVTIVAVGPMTNLALAIEIDPDLASKVHRVVLMGGNAYCRGNASAAAEANVLNDPEAADIVFAQDWDLTMVGLDVTDQTNLSRRQLASIAGVDHPTNQLLGAAMPFYQRFYEEALPGYEGLCPHDAVAIVWLFRPELFTTVDRPVAVGIEGIGRGKTWPAEAFQIRPGSPWEHRRSVRLCTGGDVEAISDVITERLLSPNPIGD